MRQRNDRKQGALDLVHSDRVSLEDMRDLARQAGVYGKARRFAADRKDLDAHKTGNTSKADCVDALVLPIGADWTWSRLIRKAWTRIVS